MPRFYQSFIAAVIGELKKKQLIPICIILVENMSTNVVRHILMVSFCRMNVTGDNSRISEYHKNTLGIYTRVKDVDEGFTAPVFKKGEFP